MQQIQATDKALAAILGDGFVVSWGENNYGGDSMAVRDQLKNVQQIQSTSGAFAAILGGGSVVSWGDNNYGGHSKAVQDQLKNVQLLLPSSAMGLLSPGALSFMVVTVGLCNTS